MAIFDLATVAAGTDIFVDANVIIYALTGKSNACAAFLDRCLRAEVYGITNAHVLLNVTHKLMLLEAKSVDATIKGHLGLKAKLAKDPTFLASITGWKTSVEQFIQSSNIEFLEVSDADVLGLQRFAINNGQLTGDALIQKHMDDYGYVCVASKDQDFSRGGWDVYEPRDI